MGDQHETAGSDRDPLGEPVEMRAQERGAAEAVGVEYASRTSTTVTAKPRVQARSGDRRRVVPAPNMTSGAGGSATS
jgi:hypothetical protein